MEKFSQHTGVGVPLRRSNVDTDQIIPAVYLKRVTRTGFEDALFAAWRGDPAFILNQDAYKPGSVLVAGPVHLPTPPGVQRVDVRSAAQMHEAVMAALPADVYVGAAAVADFTPRAVAADKIKKVAGQDTLALELVMPVPSQPPSA